MAIRIETFGSDEALDQNLGAGIQDPKDETVAVADVAG